MDKVDFKSQKSPVLVLAYRNVLKFGKFVKKNLYFKNYN